MSRHLITDHPANRRERGYSLIELMVAVTVLLIVSAGVFEGMLRLSRVNDTISNRSEMHSGVRNATELLAQEIGQAGRVALPDPVFLTDPVGVPGPTVVGVTSVAGMFVGEQLVIGTGNNQETVVLTAVNTAGDTIQANFVGVYPIGTPVSVHGGFAAGIVPTTVANGSTPTVLKVFGDIHDDGNMVYIEYTCDYARGNLYRNALAFDAAAKPAVTVEQVLLDNIQTNPDGTPCFTYQEKTVTGTTYVVGVAITLTVRTQDPDPVTGLFQTETKALLNVSPRNVFHVWQLASLGINNRVQPTPQSVQELLP